MNQARHKFSGAGSTSERQAYLAERLRSRSKKQSERIRPQEIGELAPLSYSQGRLWFLDRMGQGERGEDIAYLLPQAFFLKGDLDVALLVRSLELIVERHSVLRSYFPKQDGVPCSAVSEKTRVGFEHQVLSRVPEVDALETVRRSIREQTLSPMSLEEGSLFRSHLFELENQRWVFVVVMHHIVSDLWSLGVFNSELETIYNSLKQDQEPPLVPLDIQYADFAAWQQKWMQGDVKDQQLSFWKEMFAGDLPILNLPQDKPRPALQTYWGEKLEFCLPQKLSQSLRSLAATEDVSLFMVLYAAYAAVLNRYSSQDEIVIGYPIANRNRVELEPLIGFFVNTLALKVEFTCGQSFRELLEQVRSKALSAFSHQDLPFESLIEELKPERDPSRNPLFQVQFAFQSTPRELPQLSGLEVDEFPFEAGTSIFDLTLFTWENGEEIRGNLEFNSDLFERASIERLLGHFQVLLEAAVEAPETEVAKLPLLTVAEKEEFCRFGQAQLDSSGALSSLPILFEEQVRTRPESLALSFAGEELSYAELNRRANQLAHHLLKLGIEKEELVALYCERSIDTLLGILGILKAGAAYLPIDPIYPAERISFMLEDAQVSKILTQESLVSNLALDSRKAVCLDRDWSEIEKESGENLNLEIDPQSLAYVIFTSGSSGRPKGVRISHANVSRLFSATESLFSFSPNDVWTFFHSAAFDFSVWEIWGALLYGGRLVVVPYLTSRSPTDFYRLLAVEGVTVLNQTPSAFRELIRAEQQLDPAPSLSLRYVVFGGEALDMQSLKPWFDRHGEESPQLINMYGITETCVHVTYRRIKAEDLSSSTSSVIGLPIPDLGIYLADRYGNPVPQGVPGEIYVSGAGLAQGYLNRPELSAERFCQNPFGEGLVYRSGDLVRRLSNGELDYLGRIDQQIKIRGFRIEIGEIENCLGEHSDVQEKLLILSEVNENKQLLAYLTLKPGLNRSESELQKELRVFLGKRLPDYMIPSVFIVLDSFPLTSNGKIDRKALPSPNEFLAASEVEEELEATSGLERQVATVWAQVLDREKIGVCDNFFDIGGHSLLAVELQIELQKSLRRKVSVLEIFQYPSVRSFVDHLSADSSNLEALKAVDERAEKQRAARAKRRTRI